MRIADIFKQPVFSYTLRDYRLHVEDEADAGFPVKILETNKNVLVVESDMDTHRIMTIANPAFVNESWIADRLVVTPSALELNYSLDTEEIAKYLASNVSRHYMLTLDSVVFCNDVDKDLKYLSQKGVPDSVLESNIFPTGNHFGEYWYDTNKILINMGSIVNYIEECISRGEIEKWEEEDAINDLVMVTLLKEVRYLAHGNPYIPEEIMQQDLGYEADAKDYAIRIYSRNKAYVVSEKDDLSLTHDEPEYDLY